MSNAQFVGLWGLVAAIYTQESIFISLGFYFIACMAGAISLIVLRLKCVRQSLSYLQKWGSPIVG